MFDGLKTLDDYDLNGKTVILRLDLNSPIDPETGEFLDDRRFVSHKETIQELIKKKAKTVCLAHQGRPGDEDFTTLEKHAEKLGKVIGKPVKYVDSLLSKDVGEKIKKMKEGDVILLENTRFYSEEILQRPPDAQAKTILVQKLSKTADMFINDGFAVAHRSQPSVVGFPMLLPSAMGRLMEKEYTTITNLLKNPKPPIAFVLGGTKADDSINVMGQTLTANDCKILTGGLVANIFLAAKGYRLGEPNIEFIRGKKLSDQIDVAADLLEEYEADIILPNDLAVERKGERLEIPVSDLPTNDKISDIGEKTIENYVKIISESNTIFANGALGIFEKKEFAKGTEAVIKAIADSEGFSVIGGGHTVAAARELGVGDKINHISSGGGACVNLLAGYKLPAIEALKLKGGK
ncbi:MAG: phosphoglycerate kinase [Candidatus Altiarchaeota archaeon]